MAAFDTDKSKKFNPKTSPWTAFPIAAFAAKEDFQPIQPDTTLLVPWDETFNKSNEYPSDEDVSEHGASAIPEFSQVKTNEEAAAPVGVEVPEPASPSAAAKPESGEDVKIGSASTPEDTAHEEGSEPTLYPEPISTSKEDAVIEASISADTVDDVTESAEYKTAQNVVANEVSSLEVESPEALLAPQQELPPQHSPDFSSSIVAKAQAAVTENVEVPKPAATAAEPESSLDGTVGDDTVPKDGPVSSLYPASVENAGAKACTSTNSSPPFLSVEDDEATKPVSEPPQNQGNALVRALSLGAALLDHKLGETETKAEPSKEKRTSPPTTRTSYSNAPQKPKNLRQLLQSSDVEVSTGCRDFGT